MENEDPVPPKSKPISTREVEFYSSTIVQLNSINLSDIRSFTKLIPQWQEIIRAQAKKDGNTPAVEDFDWHLGKKMKRRLEKSRSRQPSKHSSDDESEEEPEESTEESDNDEGGHNYPLALRMEQMARWPVKASQLPPQHLSNKLESILPVFLHDHKHEPRQSRPRTRPRSAYDEQAPLSRPDQARIRAWHRSRRRHSNSRSRSRVKEEDSDSDSDSSKSLEQLEWKLESDSASSSSILDMSSDESDIWAPDAAPDVTGVTSVIDEVLFRMIHHVPAGAVPRLDYWSGKNRRSRSRRVTRGLGWETVIQVVENMAQEPDSGISLHVAERLKSKLQDYFEKAAPSAPPDLYAKMAKDSLYLKYLPTNLVFIPEMYLPSSLQSMQFKKQQKLRATRWAPTTPRSAPGSTRESTPGSAGPTPSKRGRKRKSEKSVTGGLKPDITPEFDTNDPLISNDNASDSMPDQPVKKKSRRLHVEGNLKRNTANLSDTVVQDTASGEAKDAALLEVIDPMLLYLDPSPL